MTQQINWIAMEALRHAINFCRRDRAPGTVRVIIDDIATCTVTDPANKTGSSFDVRLTRQQVEDIVDHGAFVRDVIRPHISATFWPNRRRWLREAVLNATRVEARIW